jgi:hypothetical protein
MHITVHCSAVLLFTNPLVTARHDVPMSMFSVRFAPQHWLYGYHYASMVHGFATAFLYPTILLMAHCVGVLDITLAHHFIWYVEPGECPSTARHRHLLQQYASAPDHSAAF